MILLEVSMTTILIWIAIRLAGIEKDIGRLVFRDASIENRIGKVEEHLGILDAQDPKAE